MKTPKPDLLKLRAEMKRQDLPTLCHKEGRTARSALRVASHLVRDEDVKGMPPAIGTPAIELAKQIHRLELKAEDPEYPESARRWYLENEENRKLLPEWMRKALA